MVLAAGSTVDKPVYRAVTCNSGSNYGTFGATAEEGVKYELDIAQCEECPTGTATKSMSVALYSADRYAYDAATGGFYSPTACLTAAGFSFDGIQATPCPKGWYNDAQGDDANKCTECPTGITTYSEQSQSAADCKYVLPGWQFPNAANPAANVTQCSHGEQCAHRLLLLSPDAAYACFRLRRYMHESPAGLFPAALAVKWVCCDTFLQPLAKRVRIHACSRVV
jgi:hypothetical protein